ncbi:DUF4129 domain-containing protein [Ktedonospora formicarum]|uniref:Protein-glutamine gamma-glutamyltransferase-like C-terminal domain-containing protein n=1 Tax=Ktedonospora formicarum TaxID=2778364 RepID=A0A8J3HRP3_9CHLR|nr:DUF4129 domain-containing protein [Ktedonospora formicarum]GHO42374.1 hypothetical protein KSX_05370 [Ktedonospora formicarum]
MKTPVMAPHNDRMSLGFRRRRAAWMTRSSNVERTASLGERVLPYLLALLDACIVLAVLKGMASMSSFAGAEHVVPFWWLFLLSCLMLLLVQARGALAGFLPGRWLRRLPFLFERQRLFASIVLGLSFCALVLVTIWVSFYTTSASLLDTRWLMALLNDLQMVPARLAQLLFIFILASFFGVRALWLVRRRREAGEVAQTLKIGVGLLLVALLLRALVSRYDVDNVLLLDIPALLTLGLLAHALALVMEKRREHDYAFGLLGSVAEQERSLGLGVVLLGFFLLLIALLIVALMTPIWLRTMLEPLLSLWRQLLEVGQNAQTSAQPDMNPATPGTKHLDPSFLGLASVPVLWRVGGIVLLAMLIGYLLTNRAWIRYATRERWGNAVIEEYHVTIWSWDLFVRQARALLNAIWRWLFIRKAILISKSPGFPMWHEALSGPHATRSIREIYRELLLLAFHRGCARYYHETPREFQQRLYIYFPRNTAELVLLTDIYNRTRYGNLAPSDADVEVMTHSWQAILHSY